MKHATSTASAAVRTLPATLLVLAAAIPGGAVLGQNVERSFAVAEGDRVVLVVERAHVSVTSWDRPEVAFSATKVEGFEFEFGQEDGVVTISGSDEERRGIFRWWSWGPLAEVTMKVPYRQDLNLSTSGGDIEIGRLQGEVTALTSGGSVEAGLASQTVVDSELRTSGGNVTVYLREDFQADLSASTSGGGITSDFPELAPENSAGGGDLEQAFNGGGPALVLRTSGGSIRIRRLEDGTDETQDGRQIGF